MKIIIALILILYSFSASSQVYITKDTSFSGLLARVSYVDGFTDSTNLILVMHGNGEVGTGTNYAQTYGPHYWMNNGYTGGIVLGNGTHYPVYVTLQQAALWTRPWVLKPIIDVIKTRFKVKYGGLHAMGLSGGGWCWQHVATYKPTAGDYSYYSIFRSLVNIQGVKADNVYGSTLGWPQKFGNASKIGGLKYTGFEQVLDNRDIDDVVDAINDSISGNGFFYWTNFGSSGHSNFNDFYNPSQTNWTLTNADVQETKSGGTISTTPFAGQQNIYQWALRQSADTSLAGGGPGNVAPTANAGANQSITIPTNSVSLSGSGNDTDGTISTYQWQKQSGPSGGNIASPTSANTEITAMQEGVYVFRLTVEDDDGATGYDDVQITVNPNTVTDKLIINIRFVN